MRRSAAPSQQGQACKRPRFTPPMLSRTVPSSETSTTSLNIDTSNDASTDQLAENSGQVKIGQSKLCVSGSRSTADIIRLITGHGNNDQGQTSKDEGNKATCSDSESNNTVTKTDNVEIDSAKRRFDSPSSQDIKSIPMATAPQEQNLTGKNKYVGPCKLKGFKAPCAPGRALSCTQNTKVPSNKSTADGRPLQECNTGEPITCYYNVMWCKLSKKKHKKWEGDAILITRGRSVTLVDMDSKEIGRGSGYKTAELQSLEEGHSLVVGGKEIEVMSVMREEEYKSGKCFQTSVTNTLDAPKKPATVSKPFVKPHKDGALPSVSRKVSGNVAPIKPRFDPTAPDALVMPRPSHAHEWQHNRSQLPLVDVVVDPYIASHLRPHQRDGVVFLYQCVMGMKNFQGKGAILADEMGLGKTVQCISVIWTLLKQGPYGGKGVIKRVIVITPGSLVKNWSKEFKKWLGNERLKVFTVNADNAIQEFANSTVYPVMVISYEMLVRNIDLVRLINFDLLVCDEGHRLKNTNIKTTSYISSLTIQRRIVLTGTPVQNDLQELYSIVHFCNPDILGSSNAFHHVYEAPILASRQPGADSTTQSLGQTRAAELNRITSMFILRRTQDINNKYLPPKVELVLFCRPNSLQIQLYKTLLTSRAVRSCFTSCTESAQHLMCIAALKKLCNHPGLIYDNTVRSQQGPEGSSNHLEAQLYKDLVYPENYSAEMFSVEHSGKLTVLRSLLRPMHTATPRQRVVLVSNYTQTLNILEKLCKDEEFSFVRLDGQTPTNKRQQLVEKFNSAFSKDFVFLLSSKAGGVGLNLIGASRLILYDIDWNPANDLQAMARVWRDGQKQKVFIYRLLTTGSLEEKMYQRQVSKQGLSSVVVDANTESKMHFTPEELKNLFEVDEDSLCSTHDLLDCACDGNSTEKVWSEEVAKRTCQLQTTAQPPTKQKNICMSELMEWQHLAGPQPQLDDVDPVLSNGDFKEVSYVFWSETQNKYSPKSNQD